MRIHIRMNYNHVVIFSFNYVLFSNLVYIHSIQHTIILIIQIVDTKDTILRSEF